MVKVGHAGIANSAERISIRFAGVGAVATLDRHMLSEKGSDEGCDGCHATSLLTRASADAAMSAISSGVALNTNRYA